MPNLVCIICFSPCVKLEEISHFLDESLPSLDTNNQNRFKTFCDYMNVSSTSRSVSSWDFSKEALPFCSACNTTVSYIFDLNTKLQQIQDAIKSNVTSLQTKIEESKDNSLANDDRNVDVDPRIFAFRRLLISQADASDQSDEDVDVNNIKRATRRAASSARARILVDIDDSDSAPEAEPLDPDFGDSDSDEKAMDIKPEKVTGEIEKPSKRKKKIQESSDESVVDLESNSSDEDFEPSGKTSGSKSKVNSTKLPAKRKIFVKKINDTTYDCLGVKFVKVSNGFKCTVCDRGFQSNKGAAKHIKTIHLGKEHTSGKSYYCGECGKLCDSPSSLRTHETTHRNIRDCICKECGKGFKNSKNLKAHLKEVHKVDIRNLCYTCNKRWKTESEYRLHLRTAHTSDNRFYCDCCGKMFPTEERLEDHLENHKGEKYFKCFYCDTHFLQKENIKKHFTNEHGVKLS